LELTGEFFVTLGPGDVLFIPEGWWHRVTSEEYTVAVSFVWDGVDQRILVKGTIYSDTSGELDFYVVRNAMKRLAIKEIQKTIEEKAKSFHIE
jgi:ribosomal protein L16 Arg81 hydroxylase